MGINTVHEGREREIVSLLLPTRKSEPAGELLDGSSWEAPLEEPPSPKLRLACCYALHVVFDKNLSWAFFFEFHDVIQTKITSPICSTTALDKNLDSEN